MLYVIHAADQIYGGANGIEEWIIWDCATEEEAWEIGEDSSIDLINSYSCITETLDADIENWTTDDMSEEDIEQLTDDVYKDDIYVAVYKIKKDVVECSTIEELERELIKDPEDFIHYCCEE